MRGLAALLPPESGPYQLIAQLGHGARADLVSRNNDWRGIVGRRERGGEVAVVPLIQCEEDVPSFWASWTEAWRESEVGRAGRFFYEFNSMTLFFGHKYDRRKMQLFRCEWPGPFHVEGGRRVFPGGWAAHPHWQFDAGSRGMPFQAQYDEKDLAALRELLSDEAGPVEFGGEFDAEVQPLEAAYAEKLWKWLPKIHFAANAKWATEPWAGNETEIDSHARGPTSTAEIRNWTTSCMRYVQREITRFG